mgnify:CR=1 FL=1
MEGIEQAHSYAYADFNESNSLFVNNLFGLSKINRETKILDVGCGDGEIPIMIFKKQICDITAVDGSESMLEEFHKKLKTNNISSIKVLKSLIDNKLFKDNKFDIVMSNSLIHHIKDISSFWKNLIRLIKNDGVILCMDLIRPDNENILGKLVRTYGGNNLTLKKDFENSLRASYTIEEVKIQLNKINNISFTIKSNSVYSIFW